MTDDCVAQPRRHRRAGDRCPPSRWAIGLLIASAACRASPDARTAVAAAEVMPTLVAEPNPVPSLSPGSVESAVVAGADGGWLYAPGDLQSSALVAVDADGRSARPLGRFGEGPGEMRASFPLWLDDTIAIGHDLATRRVVVWARDGSVRREFRPSEPVIPLGRGPGTTLLATRFRGRVEVPVLVDIPTGMATDVLVPGDSVLVALFGRDVDFTARIANAPAVGRWRDGIVVANGLTYMMGLWHGDGSLAAIVRHALPPARMGAEAVARELRNLRNSPLARRPGQLERWREELEATPVQRFSHVGAPRSDGRGRLWVVVQEGDSVHADVFADTTYLGRLPVDCPGFGGRWDLAGAWLLLVCEPVDPASELDAEVRRYRIVEPGE